MYRLCPVAVYIIVSDNVFVKKNKKKEDVTISN